MNFVDAIFENHNYLINFKHEPHQFSEDERKIMLEYIRNII